MRYRSIALFAVALCATACAGRQKTESADLETPVVATAEDDAWVSFTGTVVNTDEDGSFTVDYGPGAIEVEMDDWEWYPMASYLLANDEVVVYGKIDEGFFEKRTVDGHSVYVADLNTQFFTDGAGTGSFPIFTAIDHDPRIEMRGTITYVSGDRFMLDTGKGVVEVATDAMPYNPLDDEGYQRLSLGDEVVVVGQLTRGLFEGKELMAVAIVTEYFPQ